MTKYKVVKLQFEVTARYYNSGLGAIRIDLKRRVRERIKGMEVFSTAHDAYTVSKVKFLKESTNG